MKNKKAVIEKTISDFRELVEKYAVEHEKLCVVVAANNNLVLVRIGEDDVPTPDFDSPLVHKLEKELNERDESLEFWIHQAKKWERECKTKRAKNGEGK